LGLEITNFILLLSALIFALLDVINKKIVTKLNLSAMILYSSITIAILCFIPTIIFWKTPSTLDLLILLLLGLNSNLVLFSLLKAYLLCDISALAPYRYLELILSAIIGYIIFQEIPTLNVFYGGVIIVTSTIFIAYLEREKLYKINHLLPNNDN
jgi:S-adenosylmethionine uptake transporter